MKLSQRSFQVYLFRYQESIKLRQVTILFINLKHLIYIQCSFFDILASWPKFSVRFENGSVVVVSSLFAAFCCPKLGIGRGSC